MKFSIAIGYAAYAVLTGSALAAPSIPKAIRRRASLLQLNNETSVIGQRSTSTSTNWAGAVVNAPSGQNFNNVEGTFIVPTPMIPAGGTSATDYGASVWVGIDGTDPKCGVILQTGISIMITKGLISYGAWWEWFPAGETGISTNDFPVAAGDTIYMAVVSASGTQGTVILENKTQNKSFRKTVTGTPALCGGVAEWIVEDYSVGGLIPFADFVKVTITDTHAGTQTSNFGAAQANMININQNNKDLTTVSISGENVIVTYI